jgi:UDP-N-acetylmuramoyl-tripeptide--D-alanyl-D-alanine ligase
MSEPRELQRLAADCGGELRGAGAGVRVGRVCTDSRGLERGDLFVCLRGANFDGHRFAGEAVRRGAAAVLGEGEALAPLALACPRVLVADSRRALGLLAAAHRRRFAIPVVAVAGSNGKTTTKDLVATLLRQRFRTVASPASFNNDIGLPLTLLDLESGCQAAVVEVGSNHPGELAPLLAIAQPTHGILTRLGREHLEFFGDLDGVVREEGALAECLPASGVLILAGDGPGSREVRSRTRARVVQAGGHATDDWQLLEARVDLAGTRFTVRSPRPELDGGYRMPLLGRHQAENALLALALGAELGLDRPELAAGLAAAVPARRRLELAQAAGVVVLDDSYNANPDSMLAALATLRALPSPGRKLAVLGDMGELGTHAAAAHEEIGAAAAQSGLDGLFAVGRWAGRLVAGARAGGLSGCESFATAAEAAVEVARRVRPGDLVLVKASRATGLEVVADGLRGRAGAEPGSPPGGRDGH